MGGGSAGAALLRSCLNMLLHSRVMIVFISPKDLANHCGYPVWLVKDFQQLYGFKRHQWAEAVCELHQYATSLEH